ncbi:hypothetical protein ACJVC5_12445 [Peredibacter sp. HCB2-198]|uniref:hypothetical protein n=1 Tax=Peredibacter sp. HCB2-198 TaxID=3383025 RepID=UPI0038B445F2
MSKVIKAKVIAGRYLGEIVRITNISQDEMGRKNAACMLAKWYTCQSSGLRS